jgi:hypothetical protein
MPSVEHARERIWERIRHELATLPGDPVFVDARKLARQLLEEIPGSELDENQVALEYHRIRRAMISRTKD